MVDVVEYMASMSLTLSENPRSGSVETWGVGAWTIGKNQMQTQKKPEKAELHEKNRKTPRSANVEDSKKKKDDEDDDDEEAKKIDWKKKDSEKNKKPWHEKAKTERIKILQ